MLSYLKREGHSQDLEDAQNLKLNFGSFEIGLPGLAGRPEQLFGLCKLPVSQQMFSEGHGMDWAIHS